VKHTIADEDDRRIQLAYVVASQGYLGESFCEDTFPPWVKNVNRLLELYGFRTVLFSVGGLSCTRYSTKRKLKIIIDRKIDLLRDYYSITTTLRMLFSEKPALVVVHGLQHFLTLSTLLLFGLVRRTPILIIVHGTYIDLEPLSSIRDRIIRSLLKLLDRTDFRYLMLFLTNYDRDYLLGKWELNEKTATVSFFPLYISLEEAKTISNIEDAPEDEKRDSCTFLYVGRLSSNKQIHRIVLALHRILMRGQKGQLTIVGDGPLRKDISCLVKKLGLTSAVNMTGFTVGKEKWRFYVNSDALVLTSRREGLPRVIIEAYGAGRPVIVPRVCGISEIVENEINGFVFNDEKDLVRYMTQVIERRSFARDVGLNNKATVWRNMILERNGLKHFEHAISRLGDYGSTDRQPLYDDSLGK